jgi:UDP-N-acetylglucosamine 2-epimerase
MNKYPDYLLIKNLPGYPKGCIFTMGKNYIYYIKYNPDDIDCCTKIHPNSEWDASEKSLLRFNIHQIENNPEWFLKIDEKVQRDLKIDKLLNN